MVCVCIIVEFNPNDMRRLYQRNNKIGFAGLIAEVLPPPCLLLLHLKDLYLRIQKGGSKSPITAQAQLSTINLSQSKMVDT